MAKLSTRTLTSDSRPATDPGRSQAAREAAESMGAEINTLRQQVERLANEHRQEINSISDPQLRKGVGAR